MVAAAALKVMRAKIREQGWIVTGVGDRSDQCSIPGCSHGGHPAVALDPCMYTAGLTVAGLPELLMQHVPAAAAYPILQALARWSMSVELIPGESVRVAKLGVVTVEAVPAAEGRRLCVISRQLYGDGIRVLRVSRADDPAGR